MRSLFLTLAFALLSTAACERKQTVLRVDGRTWNANMAQARAPGTQRLDVAVLGTTQPSATTLIALRKGLRNAREENLHSRSLTLADIGIAAVHRGDVDIAASALDDALAILDAVIYDPEKSREIAALSGEERTKIFRGEPHERALCNLYRGLVYLAKGDYESARACFLRGGMYRATTESGAIADGRWLSLECLAALSDSLCPTQIGITWPANAPPELEAPPYCASADTVLLLMSGVSPLKQSYHRGDQLGLGYRRVYSDVATIECESHSSEGGFHPSGQAPTSRASGPANARDNPAQTGFAATARVTRPTEDLYTQAVSRGRREMDELLASKEAEAQRRENAGAALEWIGPATPPLFGANLVVMTAGSAVKSGASNVDSMADLRSIHGPACIYVLALDSHSRPITVRALTESGDLVGEIDLPPPEPSAQRPRVVVIRTYR
jgi:hypothetical protein